MRQLAILAVLVAFAALPVRAADTAAAPIIVMPTQLAWTTSDQLPAGSKMAVLQGDPSKPGYYTIRFSLPDGAAFPVHLHGTDEYVTVLEGTLLVGLGDTVDKAKMTALPAGSFVAVPAGLHHYALAKGATVLQLSGAGPMTTTMPAGK
ncbi:MAG: cupin domain-containing protein [Candidatus Eremiobacteraeota bacterium]|nr:cupin domain-containing protein [Candidatus Eremiobacteraeota bacterium]